MRWWWWTTSLAITVCVCVCVCVCVFVCVCVCVFRSVECEVVVVDDRSHDNSVDLISRFLDPSGVWAGTRVCVCVCLCLCTCVCVCICVCVWRVCYFCIY